MESTYINMRCLAETMAIANTINEVGSVYYIDEPDIINAWFAEVFYPSLLDDTEYHFIMLESAYKMMMAYKKNGCGTYVPSYNNYHDNLAYGFINDWLIISPFDKIEKKTVKDRFGYEHEIEIPEKKLFKCQLLLEHAKDRMKHFRSIYGKAYEDMCFVLNKEIPRLNQNILKNHC